MNLCFEIASHLYRKKLANNPGMREKLQSHGDYWRGQFTSSKRYFALFPGLDDLAGKTVLDLGCGIGGRAAYLATTNAKSVVGIDINHPEIDIANEMAKSLPPEAQAKLSYHKTSENDVGDIGQFDIVLLVDSLEHARNPVDMLTLAHSLTKPGGVCYFGVLGWYHWKGSHMMHLGIPWVNVFFSDEQICDAARRLCMQKFYIPSRFDPVPPEKAWEGITDLSDRPGEYLNKITIKGMREAMQSSPFATSKLYVLGFQKSPLNMINFLCRIPVLNEMIHSYCVGRMVKA